MTKQRFYQVSTTIIKILAFGLKYRAKCEYRPQNFPLLQAATSAQVLIHIKPKRCLRRCLIGIQFHTLKCLPYYTIQGIFRYIIEDPNQENNKCTNILIKFALKRNNWSHVSESIISVTDLPVAQQWFLYQPTLSWA